MVKIYLLLVALLLVLNPSWIYAQQPLPASSVASPTASLATLPGVPDTAAALHRFFAQRRHRSYVGLGVGGGTLLVSSVLVSTASGYKDLGSLLLGALGIGVSASGLVVSLLNAVSYSKAREQRILLAWQQHRLPHYWSRHALRPEYMQAPE